MTGKQRISTIVALATLVAVGPASRAEADCNPALATLPGVDCSTDATCCVAGALAIDGAPGTVGSAARCDDAVELQALASSCPTDDFDAHILLFGIDEDSWADNGLRECTDDLFGKHWIASALIGGGILPTPGVARHTSSQYLIQAQANATTFHPQLEHVQSDSQAAFASYMPDLTHANTVTLMCPSFADITSNGMLASEFVHESWHSSYGSHDGTVGGTNADWYYAHQPDTEPLDVYAEFEPDIWPRDGKTERIQHSVYQLQHEFMCDLVQSPRDWVPRAGLFGAQARAALIETTNVLNPTSLPAWAMCGSSVFPGRTPKNPVTPDSARTVTLDFSGVIVETSEGGADDDTETLDANRVLTVSPDDREDSISNSTLGTFADGEVWIDFYVTATLAEDNETVELAYNILFFEDDADDTDCDQDLGGDNCPGAFDESLWATLSVNSVTPFAIRNHSLSNATADPGTDTADIFMNVDLSW
jgi:hypothetical protein